MNVMPFVRGEAGGRRRVAVIGSGISGAAAAWALDGHCDVTLYEAGERPGGHTATVEVDYDGKAVSVDTGFIVYNELNYPELTALFAHLGVTTHASDMGFALSVDGGRLEWAGENLRTIFSQKSNLVSPTFLWMLREILRFNRICTRDRDNGVVGNATIGEYLARRRFSTAFRDDYLIPMAAAIWSTPSASMLDYPAASFIRFFENHRLIHIRRPCWRTVSGGSRRYLDKLLAPLGPKLRLATPVRAILRDEAGVTVLTDDMPPRRFDDVVVATHSDQALGLLGDPSPLETRLLAAIPYRPNRVVLHRDERLMPRRRHVWSAWNYARTTGANADHAVSVTYWMNRLQGIDPALPLFVSLNPVIEPRADKVFGEWSMAHPQFDAQSLAAQARLGDIQGVRRTWFAGAWTGHGFHEDGLRSGLDAACALGAVVPWRDGRVSDIAIAAE